jgi:hypothetical protein
MRVRLLQATIMGAAVHPAGEIVEVQDFLGIEWLKSGRAEAAESSTPLATEPAWTHLYAGETVRIVSESADEITFAGPDDQPLTVPRAEWESDAVPLSQVPAPAV